MGEDLTAGYEILTQYIEKVFPAAKYMVKQLTDLETQAQYITYEHCAYAGGVGRDYIGCQDEISDVVVQITSFLSDIGWTVHRLGVLFDLKTPSLFVQAKVAELTKLLIEEYGPTSFDNESTGDAKQLALSISTHHQKDQVGVVEVGGQLYYECPKCNTYYESEEEMAICTCEAMDRDLFDEYHPGHHCNQNGWDTSHQRGEPIKRVDKPSKYDKHACSLVSAVKTIQGGD